MTNIGWELWGLKFSWFLTALLSTIFTLYVWLTSRKTENRHHVDAMAGDEGDW